MIAAALAGIAVAMLLVRFGWGGRRAVASGGWALAAAALVVLAGEAGAWGLAMGTVTGIVVAASILLHAGWIAPVRNRRAARQAPAITLPHHPRDIARRAAVFVLVVPVAFAAAQWLAFGAQALARRGGAGEADATVLALFLQPLLWSVLMAWQMTRAAPAKMIAPPALAAVAGTMLWGLA